MVRVLQKARQRRTEGNGMNLGGRTGERCSASQYVNKYRSTAYPLNALNALVVL